MAFHYSNIRTLGTSPKSEPAMEVIGRAVPSVEAYHHSVGLDAGRKFLRKADNEKRRKII